MAAAPPLRDRLSFLHRLPVLLKGTSDDEAPCPGYLFEEISKISHESPGSSQCLLEYLLGRLHGGSGHVKLKVLKILLHLCAHGSPAFLLLLKRNPAFIQEATVFAGPPDPLHGNSLYRKVRRAAQDLGSALFCDAPPPPPAPPPGALPPAGMGSQGAPRGFGYSRDPAHTGSAGEVLLATVQKAAEAVALAVRPGPEGPAAQRPPPRGDAYQPAETPSAGPGHRPAGQPPSGAPPAARHQPGQPGGGWDQPESSPQPQSSPRGSSGLSEASGAGSHSGSDSPPGAGGAPGDLAERLQAATLRDCGPELRLVRAVTRGPRAFLSRDEALRFTRECGRLNCEVVLELLIAHLAGASECQQMRALGALATLGATDLLAQEQVLLCARPRLQELSVGSPGPVTSKATKVLRHFEASCGQRPPARRPAAGPGPAACGSPSDLLAAAVPFLGGPASLQPQSSALLAPPTLLEGAPRPGPQDTGEAANRLAGSGDHRAGPEPGPGAADTLEGSGGSLFAGMELVSCPRLLGTRAAAEGSPPDPRAPPTSMRRAVAEGPPGSEPSAFAFLNV